ncbi:MAG: IMPACT family protein [Propionibacteriaceae bacterium]|jgi:uncharacterized YigZ family protein|nr:IMPACT family protein [Propionibacteriaceae bacterium]
MDLPRRAYRATTETIIKRSRFITDLARTDTEADARTFIASVRSAYPDARHHCTAYVLDDDGQRLARSSDDGEPAGTAGIPMLNALTGAGLTNTAAVVTRYFGGVKLGAGGLARAYGGCVASATAAVPRVRRETRAVWLVCLPHADAGRYQEELLRAGAAVIDTAYDDTSVRLRLTLPDDPLGVVARATGGTVRPAPHGTQVVELPV